MSSKLPIIVLLGVPWRILETWRLRAANLTNPKISKHVSIKLVADGTLWYSITQNVNDSGCVYPFYSLSRLILARRRAKDETVKLSSRFCVCVEHLRCYVIPSMI